jgi:NADH:ubiquinone oxidoreductase subunit F (NADH-binding)
MNTALTTRRASRLIAPDALHGPPTLEAHLRRYGPLSLGGGPGAQGRDRLLAEIERSGLTGRGGAGFPTARKLASARAADRPALIVNAMEGEPASAKDRLLVGTTPHLVLDGADVVATVLGAQRTVLCVADSAPEMARSLVRAQQERTGRGRAGDAEVRTLSGRYVAGEESALASAVAGGPGVPRFRPDKSVPLSVGRHAAVVHNAETLAHVALIARYGADWFREVGAAEAPGTCLVTISGGVECPGVVEVATGAPVSEIIGLARLSSPPQAVLVGGYGGTWLAGEDLGVPFAPGELSRLGASMGAGVLVVLPGGTCGIQETALVARFMAGQSAGQCGPCLFGLPAIADDLAAIADGTAAPEVLDRLLVRCGAVAGRGACRHPDGVVRLVRSALEVFSADVASHVHGHPCRGRAAPSGLMAQSGLMGSFRDGWGR